MSAESGAIACDPTIYVLLALAKARRQFRVVEQVSHKVASERDMKEKPRKLGLLEKTNQPKFWLISLISPWLERRLNFSHQVLIGLGQSGCEFNWKGKWVPKHAIWSSPKRWWLQDNGGETGVGLVACRSWVNHFPWHVHMHVSRVSQGLNRMEHVHRLT